jgi:hypothetical protein
MMQKTKVTLIAPFWGQTGHVGNHRMERIARWLSNANLEVILLRAGSLDQSEKFSHGTLITLRDPLNLYPEKTNPNCTTSPRRKSSALRRQIAYWLFNPDPTIVWAHRALRHPLVKQASRGSTFFMASSPPESGHVLAWALAKDLGGAYCVDMRDGWLDEPLKQYLHRPGLRRWREARLEKKILQSAQCIFVTSPAWKTLLESRLPFTSGKTAVVTNTYPNDMPRDHLPKEDLASSTSLQLIYAGQFSKSRPAQEPALLFEPLLGGIKNYRGTGHINVIGKIPPNELNQFEHWQIQLRQNGWELRIEPTLPRQQLLERLVGAHGLLLLSAAHAPIPSKIFEYIAARRPIFCATPKGSAVWKIGGPIQQIFLADLSDPLQSQTASEKFLRACCKWRGNFDIPDEFSEETAQRRLLNSLGIPFREADC